MRTRSETGAATRTRARAGATGVRLGILLSCLLAGFLPAGAAIGWSLSAGRLEWHDERLQQIYAACPSLGLELSGPRWGPLAPRLDLGLAWDGHDAESAAFVEGAETRMLLVPILWRAPLEFRFAPAWRLSIGPEAGWAWFRETWKASVPAAGLESSRHGTGGWALAGLIGELGLTAGPAGEFSVAAEILWGSGKRTAVGSNEAQSVSIDAGWTRAALRWRPPWPAAREEER